MSEPINVQWFPGHMAKTRRQIKESLSLVDGIVERMKKIMIMKIMRELE